MANVDVYYVPPYVESILFWAKRLKTFDFPKTKGTVCKECLNERIVHQDNKIYRCVCELNYVLNANLSDTMYDNFNQTPSYSDPTDIEPWGMNTDAIDETIAYRDMIETYISDPTKWLLLRGMVGCGKTLGLNIISSALYPWVLTMASSRFETYIKESISTNTVGQAIRLLSRVPFLIIDDLGAEYYKNDTWAKNQLRTIIDNRYTLWKDRITIVATNMPTDDMLLRMYDQRIGSRLLDKEKVIIKDLTIKDYRRKQ